MESKLTVWYGPMPESNGRTNWTAILHRGSLHEGFTLSRSEYPGRVRYAADEVRWLLGELDKEPHILDYDGDECTPCHLCGGSGEKDGKRCWGLNFDGTVHDTAPGSPLNSSGAVPEVSDEPSEAVLVCYEAYQVVGSLLSDLGKFDTDEAEKILDNLSQARLVHKDVLPWPSFVASPSHPEEEGRKSSGGEMFKSGLEKAAMSAEEAHAAFGHLAPKDGVMAAPVVDLSGLARVAAMQHALTALQHAQAGLNWYGDRYPEARDGSDDEAAVLIAAAMQGLRDALGVGGTDGVTASDGGLWQVSYNGGESWVDWPRKPDPNRDAGLAMAKVRHLAGVTLPDGANMADPKIKNEHLIRGVLAGGVLQFKAGGQWIDCGGDADGWMSIIVAGGGCDPHTHRIKPGSVPHGVSGMEVQQIVECVFCKRQMIDGSQCTKPTIAAVCDMRTAGVKEGGDAPAA